MALDQLPQFMQAIGTIESGNRYDAVGPYTGSTYGRARGRYQIMETIYPGWAKEAGVDPNDMSPSAQDRVAEFKMRQYYNRYGDWDLVAVAWFAGPGRANKAQKEGLQSLAHINDKTATTKGTAVPTYVKKVRQAMGRASSNPQKVQEVPPAGTGSEGIDAAPVPEAAPVEDEFAQNRRNMSNLMANIMSFVSQRATETGGRILDLGEMFGEKPIERPTDVELPTQREARPEDQLPPAPGEPQRAV